jgi:hypothetical protein
LENAARVLARAAAEEQERLVKADFHALTFVHLAERGFGWMGRSTSPTSSGLTRLLKEMSLETQFILITHSKKTMESAQVMYGVASAAESAAEEGRSNACEERHS